MARYDRIAPIPIPAREAAFPGWLMLRDLAGRERDPELARRARLRFLALRPLVGEQLRHLLLRFEVLLVADDPQVDRPVSAQVPLLGVHADGSNSGRESPFLRPRHRILTHEHDQIGAHQGIVRHAARQTVLVGEMPAHRAGRNHSHLVLFSRLHQRGIRFTHKHAVSGDKDGALRLVDHVDCLLNLLRSRMGPGFAPVLVFAEEKVEFGGILKTRICHLGWKVQVYYVGDSRLEMPECVGTIFVDPARHCDSLAPFLNALGDGLLIHKLDVSLPVLRRQVCVAGEDEQGGIGKMR